MSKAATARSKFAELRALRESGKKRLDTYEVSREEDLYDELDEEGYKRVVRDRLNQDDFVIDDNGEGYVDDGREDWDRRAEYDSQSDGDLPVKGKSNTKAGEYIIGVLWIFLMVFSQAETRRGESEKGVHGERHQQLFHEGTGYCPN